MHLLDTHQSLASRKGVDLGMPLGTVAPNSVRKTSAKPWQVPAAPIRTQRWAGFHPPNQDPTSLGISYGCY